MKDAIPIIRQLVRDWAEVARSHSSMEAVEQFSEECVAPTREQLLAMYRIYVPVPVLEWGPMYMGCALSWYIALPGKGSDTEGRAYVCMMALGDVRFTSAETAMHAAAALNYGKEILDEQATRGLHPDDSDAT